jgi:phage-related protein
MPTKLPTAKAQMEWIGSSRGDLRSFPKDVRSVMAYALLLAEQGSKHPDAKPMTGNKAFKGAGVVEIVDDFDGNTYRAVYTVRFAGAVYVLHAFQKKSKSGIATPKADIDRIVTRLKAAEEHYKEHYAIAKTG